MANIHEDEEEQPTTTDSFSQALKDLKKAGILFSGAFTKETQAIEKGTRGVKCFAVCPENGNIVVEYIRGPKRKGIQARNCLFSIPATDVESGKSEYGVVIQAYSELAKKQEEYRLMEVLVVNDGPNILGAELPKQIALARVCYTKGSPWIDYREDELRKNLILGEDEKDADSIRQRACNLGLPRLSELKRLSPEEFDKAFDRFTRLPLDPGLAEAADPKAVLGELGFISLDELPSHTFDFHCEG